MNASLLYTYLPLRMIRFFYTFLVDNKTMMLQYFTSNVDVHHIFVSDCFRWQPREIEEETVPGRWYTQSQVSAGKELFQANCGVCHGMEAEGTVADWRKTPLESGIDINIIRLVVVLNECG